MDSATADFYRHYAEQGAIRAEAPESAVSTYFERAFAKGGKVLDIGSGSGRDLAVLCDRGFDAYGIEPNDAMRAFAAQQHPALQSRMQPGSLPLSGMPFGGRFDGVVCNAVLMHLPEVLLADAWQSIRSVLKPGGRLLFSLPAMRDDLLDGERDRDGRFFQNHSPASIDAMLSAIDFSRIDLGSQARSVYPEISWTIFLYALKESA
jgi:SAM-dependent methyltransferase